MTSIFNLQLAMIMTHTRTQNNQGQSSAGSKVIAKAEDGKDRLRSIMNSALSYLVSKSTLDDVTEPAAASRAVAPPPSAAAAADGAGR